MPGIVSATYTGVNVTRSIHPNPSPRRSSPPKPALEGKLKLVTAPSANLKGSMELLADRAPRRHTSSSTLRSPQ
jgi:hypothetical protein